MPSPYINVHTHAIQAEKGVISVHNVYPDTAGTFSLQNFYSLGIHPWHLSASEQKNNLLLEKMERLLQTKRFLFVGEVGLDKFAKTNFSEQERVFELQALMAEKYQLPLLIHCVKAFNGIIELRKKINSTIPWLIHAYNGTLQLTKQMEKQGFLFSFGESIFRATSKGIDSLKYLPAHKFFLETDESSVRIQEIYAQAAMLKSCKKDKLKTEISENFFATFTPNLESHS